MVVLKVIARPLQAGEGVALKLTLHCAQIILGNKRANIAPKKEVLDNFIQMLLKIGATKVVFFSNYQEYFKKKVIFPIKFHEKRVI
jgi:hypothetical protein